jgi:hypothetical protein
LKFRASSGEPAGVVYRQKHLLAIEGLTPPEIGHLLATEYRCDAERDEPRPACVAA